MDIRRVNHIEEVHLPVITVRPDGDHMTGVLSTRAPRVIHNSPFEEFFPGEPVIVIDWTKARDDARRIAEKTVAAAKARSKKLEMGREIVRILGEFIERPIHYDGKVWYGNLAWGSMVKNNATYGLQKDLGVNFGLMKTAEDGSRFGRAFLPDCRFGSIVMRDVRIKLVQDGETFAGVRFNDGCSGVPQSLAEAIYNGTPKIQLSTGRQNYQVWQRYSWPDIAEEASKAIKANLERHNDANDISWTRKLLHDVAGKDEYIDLDPAMLHHPFLVNALSRSVGELMAELASTIPVPAEFRVVIPSRTNEIILPDGRYLIVRFPIDSWGNVRAYDLKTDPAELAWCMAQECIQYSLTGKDLNAKGNMLIIPDELMEGYDLVLCVEDIKMYRKGEVKEIRKMGQYVHQDELVLGFLQWWGAGSCTAVPHWIDHPTRDTNLLSHVDGQQVSKDPRVFWHWDETSRRWLKREYVWKSFGGDFDGDTLEFMKADEFPKIFEATQAFPVQSSFKIEKSRSTLTHRSGMIRDSMFNAVGWATNDMSTTFAGGILFRNTLLPVKMGFKTVEEMDDWCNRAIKVMTDGFKSNKLDLFFEQEQLAFKQGHLVKWFGRMAPWSNWGRSEWAFRSGLPNWEDRLTQSERSKARHKDTGKEYRKSAQWRSHITERMRDSTISHIYEVARPIMQEWYAGLSDDDKPLISEITVAPLSDFTDYAPQVDAESMRLAYDMQELYNEEVKHVFVQEESFTDEEVAEGAMESFEGWWRSKCLQWAKAHFKSETHAAYALWRVAHLSRSKMSGAGSVFLGFPEEAKKIVKDKPGRREQAESKVQLKTLVLGVPMNFENGCAPERLTGEPVEIVILDVRGERRKVVRAHGDIPGIKTDRKDGFPDKTIGMIVRIEKYHEKDGIVSPGPGNYLLNMHKPLEATAYIAYLTPIS